MLVFCFCSAWAEEAMLHDEDYGDVYASFGCSVALTDEGSVLAVGRLTPVN